MSILGNVLWFIFGGFLSGLFWCISGLIWCITIVGIPYGIQCFKFATLSFAPFGKEIEYGGGVPSLFANIIWIIFFGIPMAIENFLFGCIWCITIVGIPFGLQFFKIAKLSLAPFGAKVEWKNYRNGENVDISLVDAITFDPYTQGYYRVAERVGNAFKDGLQLKK